jgi:hypothetical protein
MSSWFKILEEKPDHPMSDAGEARKLLADLPENNPLKALDDVTSWLASVKDTPGFHPERRADVIMLLDETGQQFQAELLQQYLSEPNLQDFKGLRLWRGIHGFMVELAEAYAVCAQEYAQEEKKPQALAERMPVICVRLLRAVAERMKLELMRYLDVEQAVWNQLCQHYRFAEGNQFAEAMVHAYPSHVIHSSPQKEFLRALVLYVSSPATLAPNQIEVSYRIAARMANLFDFKDTPAPDCPYYLDLSSPGAPRPVAAGILATPAMRFFGAARAVPKLEDIARQNERGAIDPERRFGNEFTPDGKLTVLRHLQTHWGKTQPHRLDERRGISTTIEVAHSFRTISKLVARIELDQITGLSSEEAAELKERSGKVTLASEEVDFTTNTWPVLDISVGGIGGMIPQSSGAWAKIGALCGLKPQNSALWWVGMIRRLHTDHQSKVHVGIEILAKKPLSVWLRSLGKGAERVSNWETSSGSFAYDYLPAILLPGTLSSEETSTMLMETGGYVPDGLYEAMMGEKSRNIRLVKLLEEGDDYERIRFQWLGSTDS